MTSQAWQLGFARPLWSFAQKYNLATLPLHADQALIAFAVYEAIFLFGAPIVSKLVAKDVYYSLSKKTRINWDARVVSFIQATFISICALRVIFSDADRPSMTRDQRLWSYSPQYGTVQAFAAGYFMWDVLSSTQYLSVMGPSALVHAISALLVTMLGFRPFANFYGVNFVLYELSTPFLNIHWLLDKLNMTGGTLQLWNGICLITSFFGCRLVWGSYQTWKLSTDILSAWKANQGGECFQPFLIVDTGILQSPSKANTGSSCLYEFPSTLLFIYLISNSILSLLNFYWFGLMLKALRKRFTKTKPSKTTNGQNSNSNDKE